MQTDVLQLFRGTHLSQTMKPCFPVYEEMNPIQRRHTHKAERKMCTDIVQIMEICRIQKRRKPYPTQLFPLLRHVRETLIVRHETDDHARTARDPSAEARWWSFTAQGGKRAGQGVRLLGQQFLLLSHLKGKILFVGKIPGRAAELPSRWCGPQSSRLCLKRGTDRGFSGLRDFSRTCPSPTHEASKHIARHAVIK